jgi:hypothetical protein
MQFSPHFCHLLSSRSKSKDTLHAVCLQTRRWQPDTQWAISTNTFVLLVARVAVSRLVSTAIYTRCLLLVIIAFLPGDPLATKQTACSASVQAVSYVSDHKRAARAKQANLFPVLRRRTQEASRERSTSVSVMSWKGKRGILLS